MGPIEYISTTTLNPSTTSSPLLPSQSYGFVGVSSAPADINFVSSLPQVAIPLPRPAGSSERYLIDGKVFYESYNDYLKEHRLTPEDFKIKAIVQAGSDSKILIEPSADSVEYIEALLSMGRDPTKQEVQALFSKLGVSQAQQDEAEAHQKKGAVFVTGIKQALVYPTRLAASLGLAFAGAIDPQRTIAASFAQQIEEFEKCSDLSKAITTNCRMVAGMDRAVLHYLFCVFSSPLNMLKGGDRIKGTGSTYTAAQLKEFANRSEIVCNVINGIREKEGYSQIDATMYQLLQKLMLELFVNQTISIEQFNTLFNDDALLNALLNSRMILDKEAKKIQFIQDRKKDALYLNDVLTEVGDIGIKTLAVVLMFTGIGFPLGVALATAQTFSFVSYPVNAYIGEGINIHYGRQELAQHLLFSYQFGLKQGKSKAAIVKELAKEIQSCYLNQDEAKYFQVLNLLNDKVNDQTAKLSKYLIELERQELYKKAGSVEQIIVLKKIHKKMDELAEHERQMLSGISRHYEADKKSLLSFTAICRSVQQQLSQPPSVADRERFKVLIAGFYGPLIHAYMWSGINEEMRREITFLDAFLKDNLAIDLKTALGLKAKSADPSQWFKDHIPPLPGKAHASAPESLFGFSTMVRFDDANRTKLLHDFAVGTSVIANPEATKLYVPGRRERRHFRYDPALGKVVSYNDTRPTYVEHDDSPILLKHDAFRKLAISLNYLPDGDRDQFIKNAANRDLLLDGLSKDFVELDRLGKKERKLSDSERAKLMARKEKELKAIDKEIGRLKKNCQEQQETVKQLSLEVQDYLDGEINHITPQSFTGRLILSSGKKVIEDFKHKWHAGAFLDSAQTCMPLLPLFAFAYTPQFINSDLANAGLAIAATAVGFGELHYGAPPPSNLPSLAKLKQDKQKSDNQYTPSDVAYAEFLAARKEYNNAIQNYHDIKDRFVACNNRLFFEKVDKLERRKNSEYRGLQTEGKKAKEAKLDAKMRYISSENKLREIGILANQKGAS